MHKDVGEIPIGSPPTGAQNTGGYVKIGYFRPISRYISETMQHRDILTMKG